MVLFGTTKKPTGNALREQLDTSLRHERVQLDTSARRELDTIREDANSVIHNDSNRESCELNVTEINGVPEISERQLKRMAEIQIKSQAERLARNHLDEYGRNKEKQLISEFFESDIFKNEVKKL